jgi:hypothetical protein
VSPPRDAYSLIKAGIEGADIPADIIESVQRLVAQRLYAELDDAHGTIKSLRAQLLEARGELAVLRAQNGERK